MIGRINVAEGPEFMVSRCPPNPVEKAKLAWIPRPNSPFENTPHKAGVEGGGFVAALQAAVEMTAERCSAAVLDGEQHAEMQPGQPGPAFLHETVAMSTDDIGHLERWLFHLLCSLRDRFT